MVGNSQYDTLLTPLRSVFFPSFRRGLLEWPVQTFQKLNFLLRYENFARIGSMEGRLTRSKGFEEGRMKG